MRRGALDLLRTHQAFRRLWAGQAASVLGDRVSGLALPIAAVLVLRAGAPTMGVLTAAGLLPFLVLSIPVGAWVDRASHRRRLMVWADVARAVLTLTIPLAFVTQHLSLLLLGAVAALLGSAQVVFDLAYPGVLAATVGPDHYTDANVLLQGSRAASRLVGPSLTGLLIQAVGAPVALVADAVSFAASAISLAGLGVGEPPGVLWDVGGKVGWKAGAGLRFVWTTTGVRHMMLALSTVNFFNYMFTALFILYVTRSLDVAPVRLGLIVAVGALGAAVGAASAASLGRRFGSAGALLLGVLLFTASLMLVPGAGGTLGTITLLLGVAELLSGAGLMVLDISFGSLSLALVPDALRGRAAGAFSLVNYGIRPLGALMGGFLPTVLGVQGTLWVATAGACLGAAWLLPALTARSRRIDVRSTAPRPKRPS